MAIIKNVTKPEQNARLTAMVPESLLRKAHACRLFVKQYHPDGYCPPLSQMIEVLLTQALADDKDFTSWYKPKDTTQSANIDALIKGDARTAALKDDDPL